MTSTRLFLSLILLIGLVGSDGGVALAASPEGRIPSWKQSHLKEGDGATQSLYLFAVCSVSKRRPLAEAVVNAEPFSSEEDAAIRAVTQAQDCPMRTTQLRIRNRWMFKGAFAEALYNGDKRQPKPGAALPLGGDYDSLRESWRRSATMSGDFVSPAEQRTAECAVRQAPAKAHSVLQYSPGSPAELRSLQSLTPAFLACMNEGERLTVSRLAIRALIAEVLYRASRTSRELFTNA